MRARFASLALLFFAVLTIHSSCGQAQNDPWKPNQLMQPAALAGMIDANAKDLPMIICIGPGALIKGSVDAGPAGSSGNLDKLKAMLEKENRNKSIVIYCGCCPFERCPNIRPAFNLLNSMHFTNHKLLNLSTSLKAEWLDKGYPTQH
jgi:thiosulfate/3-mercaptopyruvate sulfurtransferase